MVVPQAFENRVSCGSKEAKNPAFPLPELLVCSSLGTASLGFVSCGLLQNYALIVGELLAKENNLLPLLPYSHRAQC